MLYERRLRPLLFRLDPEEAHERMTALLELAGGTALGRGLLSLAAGLPPPRLEVSAFGLRFPNPVGLAAGFDKDCRLLRALPALGFGFVEAGSITLRPQPGKPRPRVFRIPEGQALINRLGFPSQGARAAAERLKKLGRHEVPLGLNIGLNADCPHERAALEYAETFKILVPYGDYFVLNVSSPNTPGLRDLQQAGRLEEILLALRAENSARKPVLVKLSPDLSDEDLASVVAVVERLGAGFVATNTTVSRPVAATEAGGLSGPPLRDLSTAMIRKIRALTSLPIIGVGGVATGADAFEKLQAGACLVQFYTALVYRGPGAAVLIQQELAALLEQRGIS